MSDAATAEASPGVPQPIMDLARRLQARVSDLANADQIRKEQQRLETVRASLDRAVVNLRTRSEKLDRIRECGLEVIVETFRDVESDVRTAQDVDFESSAMNSLIGTVNELSQNIDEEIRAAWSRYVDSRLPDLDGQETLAKTLLRVGGPTATKAREFLEQVESLRAVRNSTFSPLNFTSITDGAAKVNALASELAPGDDVRSFLISMTAGGAPLTEYLQSPQIQAWVEENGLLDSLRLVARPR